MITTIAVSIGSAIIGVVALAATAFTFLRHHHAEQAMRARRETDLRALAARTDKLASNGEERPGTRALMDMFPCVAEQSGIEVEESASLPLRPTGCRLVVRGGPSYDLVTEYAGKRDDGMHAWKLHLPGDEPLVVAQADLQLHMATHPRETAVMLAIRELGNGMVEVLPAPSGKGET